MNAPDILKYGHLTVMHAVEGIAPEQWNEPGACGVWSMKDIIAHLASYERVLEEILSTLLDSGPTPYLTEFTSGAGFNDAQVAARADMTPEAVLDEYKEAQSRVTASIARIPEEKRREVGTIPWYGAEYSLDDFIVYASYGHKREHCAQIAAFRDRLPAAFTV